MLPPLAIPVEQAATLLGCGRTRVFELLRAGSLRRVRIGRKTLVGTESVEALLTPRNVRRSPRADRPAPFVPVDADGIRRMLKADVNHTHRGDR